MVLDEQTKKEVKEYLTDVKNDGSQNIYSAFSTVPLFFGISRDEAKEAIEEWKRENSTKEIALISRDKFIRLKDLFDSAYSGFDFLQAAQAKGFSVDEIQEYLNIKKNYLKSKGLMDENSTKEISGDWNMRYNQAKPNTKRELDRIANEMFKENFSALDTNDQKKVIDWLGVDQVIEGAGREYAQKRSLTEIMKRTGHFATFKDQALREGYTEEDIEKYLQENRMDTDLEMFGATKETAQKEPLDVLWRDKDNVDHFVKMALDVGYDFGEVESFLKRKGVQVE